MADSDLRTLEREHKARPDDGAARNALGAARARLGLCGWCGGPQGRRALETRCAGSGAPVCDSCAAPTQAEDELGKKVLAAVDGWRLEVPQRPTWRRYCAPLIARVLDLTKGWPEKQQKRALRVVKPLEYRTTSHGNQTWSSEVRKQQGKLPRTPAEARRRNELKHDKTAALFPEKASNGQ